MAKSKTVTDEEAPPAKFTPPEQSFSKEQFLKSPKYRSKRDVLNAILENDKKYTKTEVENAIKRFSSQKIN
ncbi:hypothetical protein [Methanolapillus millepedarum]|uniref:hypothetical protein n=1 Tax=Methanolapillus millepedarum TaxID=3028296 RepID=UPI0030B8C589